MRHMRLARFAPVRRSCLQQRGACPVARSCKQRPPQAPTLHRPHHGLQVFYHLGELDSALTYALGAGAHFDVNEDSEYVRTLVGESRRG